MGKRVVSSHQLKEPGIGGGLRAASSAHLEEIAHKQASALGPWRSPPCGKWEVLGELPQEVILGGKTVNARRVVSLETKEHGTAPASESSETSEPALCTLPAHSDLAQIARSTWDRRLSAARARAPRARWASTPARAAAPPPALPRHPPPARSLRRRPLYPASLGTPP